MKHKHPHHRGTKGKVREQSIGNLYEEIVTKSFPNQVGKKTHKSRKHRESHTFWTKIGLHQDIIKIAKLKDKERILKTIREKNLVIYKGALIRLSCNFSTKTFQARRDRHEIFEVMKSKDLRPRLLYPARVSFQPKLLPSKQYCNKCQKEKKDEEGEEEKEEQEKERRRKGNSE